VDAVSPEIITDAYLYLLGRALVIRQELHDLAEPGAAYNHIKYNALASAELVNPNFDVAYLEAWIAVDEDAPALLEVPAVSGRYATAQLLDEWGEVIANINERTMPLRASGTFALLAPGSRAAPPPGAGAIFLHSRKAKLLARVELNGDPTGALALQHQFRLSGGSRHIAPPPRLPDFDNASLIGAAIFDDVSAILASAVDVSPMAAPLQQKVRAVAAYIASGQGVRDSVDAFLTGRIGPGLRALIDAAGGPGSHWTSPEPTGHYGSNYQMRTIVNLVGIWANTRDEVIYFSATRDADGQTLDGSQHYVMSFANDQLPSHIVDGYWSVIIVSVPDYRVTHNDLERYSFNSYSPLTLEADGSLKIALGPTPLADVTTTNWLPSTPGKSFSLTFRAYLPKPQVGAQWRPPEVQRVS
jgi:hypothetical protein